MDQDIPTLTPKALAEFKDIYKRGHDVALSDDEARAAADRLLRVLAILLHLPGEQDDTSGIRTASGLTESGRPSYDEGLHR